MPLKCLHLELLQGLYKKENILEIPHLFQNFLIFFNTKQFTLLLCTIAGKANQLNSNLKHDITVRELVSLHFKTKGNHENLLTTVKM